MAPAGTGVGPGPAAGITTHGPVTGVHCVSRKHSRVAAAEAGTATANATATRQTPGKTARSRQRVGTSRSFACAARLW